VFVTPKVHNHLAVMASELVIPTISAYSGGHVWYLCKRIASCVSPSRSTSAIKMVLSIQACWIRLLRVRYRFQGVIGDAEKGSDHNSRIRIPKPPAREADAHMPCCDRPLLPRIRLVVLLITP
jgi:hypothetical protein